MPLVLTEEDDAPPAATSGTDGMRLRSWAELCARARAEGRLALYYWRSMLLAVFLAVIVAPQTGRLAFLWHRQTYPNGAAHKLEDAGHNLFPPDFSLPTIVPDLPLISLVVLLISGSVCMFLLSGHSSYSVHALRRLGL